MKQLFHLKSRNLNETNLTSSKAKTLNEPISVGKFGVTNPHTNKKLKRTGTFVLQDKDSICSFNLKGTRAEAFELHPSSSRRAELSIT